MESGRNITFMKNILKKFIVLFSFCFILLGYNFVFAVDEITPDIIAPIITLGGITPIDLTVGDTYVDLGATAIDDVDSSVTIVVTGTVDTAIVGNYTIAYNAKDAAGNPATTVTRTVQVTIPIVTTPIVEVNDVVVKDNCIVTDTDGISHVFPEANSTSKFLGVCALVAAQEAKYIDSFELVNDPSMGLYVKSINNIIPSGTEYWALWVNGGYANCGIGCLPVSVNDKLSFILSDWMEETESTKILLNISALETTLPITIPSIPSTSIHLKIISGTNSLYDKDISVTACDSDNNPDTPDTITAYCAVLQSGLISKWNWAWAPGAFVDSIGDIIGYTSKDKDGKDVYHYWGWSANGSMGMTGLNEYIPKVSDVILLEFIDPQPEVIVPTSNGSGGGSVYVAPDKVFSVLNALNFLSQNKNSDGDFGGSMYTDWVAIGASAGNSTTLKSSILNYLISNPINSNTITDYERRAMALMALGVNPYTGTDVNYINKIITSYDGTQIGDSSLSNDDIFGLIVLQNAGYTKNDEIIKNVISFVIKNQSSNGSWGSVDMTAASIESLNSFKSLSGVSESISKGELYLITEQKSDGSFGNPSSTSWAVQALSLNNSYSAQVDKAIKYLAVEQYTDGGLGSGDVISNRIWDTSYAIPAVLKLSWGNIMESFLKEEIIKTTVSPIKDEIVLNFLDNKDIVKPELISEVVLPIENNEVPVKIAEIKKVKTLKKITDTKILEVSDPTSNLLSASAVGSTQNPNAFFSIIHTIIQKIEAPFVWLWYRLGF